MPSASRRAGADRLRAALRPDSGRYVQQSISSQTSREKRLFVPEPTAAWVPDENGKLTYRFESNEIDDPCVDGSQASNKTQSINGMGHVVLDYCQVFRRHAKTVIRHAGDGSALRLPIYVRTTSQCTPKLYTGMRVTCIEAKLFDKPPHIFPQGHALAVPIQREPLQCGELAETLGEGRELVLTESKPLQCGEL